MLDMSDTARTIVDVEYLHMLLDFQNFQPDSSQMAAFVHSAHYG